MLPELTQHSQFTRPSVGDASLSPRHGALITTGRPGQLERLRISGAAWEETPRNHDYAKHTPTARNTESLQFLFEDFQIPCCPSVRKQYLTRATERVWQCASADERTTTTLSTPK
jgi:hypothetical protein